MKVYKKLKKGIAMTAAASFALGSGLAFAGCKEEKEESESYAAETDAQQGEAAGDEKAMGRYLESELTLPEGCSMAGDLEFLEDGTLRFVYRDTNYEPMYVDSKDNGETWGESVSLVELSKIDPDKTDISSVKLSKDGGIFLSAFVYEDESFENYTAYGYYIDKDGNIKDISLDSFGDENYVYDCKFSENGTILLHFMTGIAEIRLSDGSVVHTYEDGSHVEYFGLAEKYLIVFVDGSIHYYDLETGNPLEDEAALTRQISSNDKNMYRNISSSWPLLFLSGDEEDSLFYVDSSGMYRYAFGGSVVEQIIDGRLNTISSPEIGFLDLDKDSQGRFYLSANNGNMEAKIYRYEYSKDVSAVPDTELKVYSLTENDFMRQAAAVFQKKYPDIYLDLEVGMTGEDAVTTTDALKTLNTEIMAGKGPDILILDGIPEDTYVEKGMLEDLSGILEKAEEADGILENILSPYKKEDGSIYSMPVKFAVPIVAGLQEDVDRISDLESLADVIEDHQEEYEKFTMPTFFVKDPQLLLRGLAEVSAGAWQKEDGTLDESAISEYLTQANRIYQTTREIVEEYWQQEGQEYSFLDGMNISISGSALSLLERSSLLALGGMYSSSDLSMLYSVEKQEPAITDKIWNGQEENCFIPVQTIGISSKASEKEAAEKFVEFLFSQEGQRIGSEYGLPVNRSVYEDVSAWKKKESDEGLGSYSSSNVETGEMVILQTYQAPDDVIAHAQELGKTLEKPSIVNEFILSAVADSGSGYLKGELSLDEAVKAILQEVNLYLSE